MPVHFLQFPHLSRRIWPAGSTIRRMWRHGWSKSSPRHVRCTFWEVETRISCEFLHVNLLVFIICPISFSKFSNIELWHKNGIYIYIHVSLNVYMHLCFYIIYISFTRTVTYDGNRLFPLWSKSCTPYIKLHFRPTASLSCSLAFKFPRASCKASVAGTLCILGGHFCAVSWHSHGNNVLWQMCVLHAMLKKTCKIGRLAFRESAVCT